MLAVTPLATAFALPSSALAAPAAQGSDTAEATLVYYYESEVVSDGTGEVVVSVYFYDDDTFELYLDFQDGEDPSMASGDYVESDDGITLTVTSADDEELDEPVELELVWDADDTLVIPGSPDGPTGEEDIILYPMDLEDAEDDSDVATDEEAGDDEEMVIAAIGGAYISPVQEEEDGSVVYLLNLLPDGSASIASDYLNLEPAILELGTWVDNGDDTATVEITGTADEEYDEPVVVELTVGGYGELIWEETPLYPLAILSYLEDDGSGDIGGEESDVDVFVAEIVLAGETEPTNIYLYLFGDGSAVLTDEEATETLYGEWSEEEEVLYVTITSNDTEDLEEAVELEFEYNDEDALVATVYPVEIFGEEAPVFTYIEDDGGEAVEEGQFFFYESEVLPNDETDGIVISLVLSDDGAAMVSTDWMNDEEPTLEYGEWTLDDDGNVVVTHQRRARRSL